MQATEFGFFLCKADRYLHTPLLRFLYNDIPTYFGSGKQNCSEHRLENIGMIVWIKKSDAFNTRKIYVEKPLLYDIYCTELLFLLRREGMKED